MQRPLILTFALGATLLVVGCGGDKDRGKNRDRDLPRLGEKGDPVPEPPKTPDKDKEKDKAPTKAEKDTPAKDKDKDKPAPKAEKS